MSLKICRKCNKEKSLDTFYKGKGYKDGYYPWCKPCKKKHFKQTKFEPQNKETKICSACKEEKAISNFYKDSHITDGYSCRCKKCKSLVTRQSQLKEKYSLTIEQYNELLQKQNGGCGICGRITDLKRVLAVDHDHKTNIIRGILCDRCNRGLGLFLDSPEFLRRAANYLENY